MGPYRQLFLPLLQRLDPESSHALTIAFVSRLQQLPGAHALTRRVWAFHDPKLSFTWRGLTFPNPIGLAAGLDKNARLVPFFAAAGAGFLEVGTVTPQPQPGNPKPRLVRLKSKQALVNRLGFPSDGLQAVARRLRSVCALGLPLGLNIGKNAATPLERAVEDYLACLEGLYPLAGYFAVNVSSPNTVGLRTLQARPALDALTKTLVAKRNDLARGGQPKPLLLKISPDLGPADLDAVAGVCLANGIDGIIATNTTIDPGIRERLRAPIEGGVSGPPLRPKALASITHLRRLLPADYFLIGVGGISSVDDVRALLDAGANALQLYTALVYQGPGLLGALNRGIAGPQRDPP